MSGDRLAAHHLAPFHMACIQCQRHRLQSSGINVRKLFEVRFRDGNGRPEWFDALAGYIARPMKSQQFLPELDDTAKGYLADVVGITCSISRRRAATGSSQRSPCAITMATTTL